MATPKYSRYYTYIKPVIENKLLKSSAPYIFSLITISILTIFAIRPTISTILNLQKNIEENRKVLQALDNKTQNLIEGKKNLDNLNQEIKTKIEVAVPAKTNIPSIISSLQSASYNQSSVSALQIQPLTITDNTLEKKALLDLGEINFTYNIQGQFNQLLATLQNLNKTQRLLNITSVIINKQPSSDTILSISGKTYYLK